MRFVILFVCLLAISTANANGQILPREVGQMGVFADPAGADCNIVDDAPGVMTFYAVHVNHESAGAVDFKVVPGPGVVATWLSDTKVIGQAFGTSNTGITIIYGSCEAAPTHVLTINYMVQGASSLCSEFRVVPNPNTPGNIIATVMCDEEIRREVLPKNLIVNPDGLCDCVVPVVPVTWGRIKSIYSGE